MTDRVRMAFVGLGRWSGHLAEGTGKCDSIEIAVCHSRSEEKRSAFSQKFGGTPVQTYVQILEDESIDAVVLATPHSTHMPLAVEAFRHGKHVYVDKPMALNVADCRRMILASREAERILAVGHNHRRMACNRKAHEIIQSGAVGEIALVEGSFSSDTGLMIGPDHWRWKRSESPTGPLLTHTVHHTDILNLLIGPTRSVTAHMSKIAGPAECDDAFSASLQFESGAQGYLGGTFITPRWNSLFVHGTGGVLMVDRNKGAVSYQKMGSRDLESMPLPDPGAQRVDSLVEQMSEFAHCIRTGEQPEVSGDEGLAAVAIVEAIMRSAEQGRNVGIQEVLRDA